jgi:hypothetical protein
VPRWLKVAAVVAVVALVAVGNMAAKNRQDRRELAAQDRIELTAKVSTNVTEFGVQLILLVRNSGRALQLAQPTLTAPGFGLVREDTPFPVTVSAGATQAIALHLDAPCTAGVLSRSAPVDARIVLPVTPPSGRLHEIALPLTDPPLPVLGRRACDFLTADGSVQPDWLDVQRERYAVSFRLKLSNHARQALVLHDVAGPGLAVSLVGGLPLDVAPLDDVIVPGRIAIPRCAGLPGQLDPSRQASSYAGLSLQVSFAAGRRVQLPVLLDPGTPLFDELRSLARTICPRGSFRSGPARRGGVR